MHEMFIIQKNSTRLNYNFIKHHVMSFSPQIQTTWTRFSKLSILLRQWAHHSGSAGKQGLYQRMRAPIVVPTYDPDRLKKILHVGRYQTIPINCKWIKILKISWELSKSSARNHYKETGGFLFLNIKFE